MCTYRYMIFVSMDQLQTDSRSRRLAAHLEGALAHSIGSCPRLRRGHLTPVEGDNSRAFQPDKID